MTVTPPEAQMLLGHTFGDHTITEYRDQGQFSLVFLADGPNASRSAVKVLNPVRTFPNALAEFEEECRLLGLLGRAANVVDRIDAGEDSIIVTGPNNVSVPLLVKFLVLECADGTLEELLAQRQQVSWQDRLSAFHDVVRGIHQMHCQEIAHRDLKSSNCLMFIRGKRAVAKVSDLGRSKDLSRPPRFSEDQYYRGQGDLRFTAPEHLWCLGSSDAGAARLADLYGLGALLFELATGVALTSLIFGDPLRLSQQNLSIPSDQRAARYGAEFRRIDAALETHMPLFEAELPAAVRVELSKLMRQLCSADPHKRTPRADRRRASAQQDELRWLTNRTAIIRKVLAHSENPSRANAWKKRQP